MRIFDDNWGLRISTVTQDQVGYSKSPNDGVLNQLELTEEKVMHSANLPYARNGTNIELERRRFTVKIPSNLYRRRCYWISSIPLKAHLGPVSRKSRKAIRKTATSLFC